MPEYAEITKYDDPCELSIDELTGLNPDFRSQYAQFGDAAIVVVGRPGGENGDGYYPGKRGLATGVSTSTGNILALSQKEKEIIGEAESHFKKVVVLINSVNPMEIGDLKDDPRISAIMWIGFPGAYGFESLVDVLTGVVSPSARLGDVMARNSALAPAMGNSSRRLARWICAIYNRLLRPGANRMTSTAVLTRTATIVREPWL